MKNNIKKSSYKVSIGVLVQLEYYLSCLGIDTEKVFSLAGLDIGILKSPDERVPVEKYIQIEDEAAKAADDPCFGLHMGQYTEAGNWSILGYMMMNCKNIGEAFEKFAKYSDIIGNLVKGEAKENSDFVRISLTVPEDAPRISRHCYEGYLSSIIRLARNISGKDVRPIEVGLAFPKAEKNDEYEKVFGCPVLFDKKDNYLIIDKDTRNIPALLPNDNLLECFENYAREFLSGIDDSNSIAYKVKHHILSNMDNEKLSIKFVARELSMSVRSLQAHLKNEGVEFSKLLKESREQLAKKYLKENYTIEDITYLLGFSDPSAFRKAFKNWLGITPKEYRESPAAAGQCL